MTLSEDKKKELVRIANEARKWAYVPYSKYAVGAALLTKSGRVYDGVNAAGQNYTIYLDGHPQYLAKDADRSIDTDALVDNATMQADIAKATSETLASATDYTDLDSMSVELTINGSASVVMVDFICETFFLDSTDVFFKLVVDSTDYTEVRIANQSDQNDRMIASITDLVTGLSAESHTFKIQYKRTGTNTANMYARNLRVVELKK